MRGLSCRSPRRVVLVCSYGLWWAAPNGLPLALFGSYSAPATTRAAYAPCMSQELDGFLSSTAPSYHVSDGIELVVSFRNRLQEPLRVRTFLAGESHGLKIRVRDAAGVFYRVPPRSGSADSIVMQSDEVAIAGAGIDGLILADENAWPDTTAEWLELTPGQYEITVLSHQNLGESQDLFEEKVADGVAVSNTINVTVVSDDQPLAAAPHLGKAKPEVACVFRHRGVEMVHADALAVSGIVSRVQSRWLLMRLGKREISLPCDRLRRPRGNKAARQGPPLAAAASAAREGYYVSLRYVAEKLGLKVIHDAKSRVYNLKPAPSRRI